MKDDDEEFNWDDDENDEDDFFDDEAWDLVENKLTDINKQIEYLESAYEYWDDYRNLKEDLYLILPSREYFFDMLNFFEHNEEYEACGVIKEFMDKNSKYIKTENNEN